MQAILRSWNKDISYIDSVIEINCDYDFSKGPYHKDNENYCPVVGSNQEILELSCLIGSEGICPICGSKCKIINITTNNRLIGLCEDKRGNVTEAFTVKQWLEN